MSGQTGTPVVTTQESSFPTNLSNETLGPVTLYQLAQNETGQFETILFQLYNPLDNGGARQCLFEILDPSGNVLYAMISPVFTGDGDADKANTLCWARGVQAYYNLDDVELVSNVQLVWTGPLPDIVLAPLSSAQLTISRGGHDDNQLVVRGIAVTINREAQASAVVAVPIEPLWLRLPDLDDGEA